MTASTLKLGKHQCRFIDSKAKFVGLFGGVGNGKTLAGALKIIELAANHPNNLCLIGRLTYRELNDSTKEMTLTWLRRLYPANAWKENKSDNSIEFWNKSKIIFRHLDEPANILSMNLVS